MRKIIRYQIFFSYGIWSKYNPLSITAQNGLYGLLDSNYYQLHNAIEFEQQNLNLIYYDFIDYGQQSIIKTIQFVDNENIQWKFEKSIDEFQYENIWYFLQIYAWPQLRTLELIIAQNQNIVFRKQLEIQYPFHDNNLILTFGGSFKVIKSQIADIALGTIFSTFPGQIILQEFSNEYIQLPLDPSIFIDEAFQTFNVCICQVSEEQQKIVDKDLQHLDQNSYIPEYVNCDSFILQGWFKIIKIVSIDQEFTYQIVRLGSNKDNQIFQNGNLAAFQLFYMISNDQYKIIFTTYSYRFPFINIDFKNNPFLIQKEYTFAQDLVNVWQYLFVKLKSNLLQVSMNIFLNDQNFIINDEIEVTQFKNVQFKLHYGNIEQNNNNYLNLQVRNLMLYNCDQNINKFGCHFSCQECDGPSNSNCLSCKEHSLRVYLSEFKVCIFPYFSIDQNEVCVTDKNQKIEIIEFKDDESNLQCKQGFFEYDGECFNCPSVIRENLISCYDCYKNPKGWSQNSFCFNEIYLQDSGNLDDVIHGTDGFYYQFDGIDLNYCYSYWQINGIQDEIAIDYLFSQLNLGFLDFCQAQENIKSNCYICNIYSCQDCYITLQGMQCIRCNQGWEFVDGVCTFSNLINPYPKGENYDDCLPPYYITSKQQCILCPILNCLYCFEYLDNFLTQNSFKPNHLFMYQEDIKIGCAMCKENYVYDFTLEKCIFQNTQIPNCLRSFIDHDGQELCTLSSINFLNSPEIYDCQNYISNCKQCLKYPSNIICVVCQTGYVVEYEQCFQNEELISTSYQIQRWRIQVESFRIQFAPSFNDIDDQIVILVNQCEPDCQICQFNDISQCQQCSLNYFKQRMRVEKGQKCSDCPQLCQLCTSRSTEDIYSLQPQFEIDDSNLIYTKQCLKPYFDKYIIFNPYSKITRYCINQLCNYYVKIDRIIKLCISQRFNYFDYRDYMDIDYLNQLGIDYIVLQSQLQVYEQDCYGPTQILAYHSLKKKLFTLRKIKIILYSLNTLFFHGPSSFDFIYFDSILIDNIGFVFEYFSMGKFRFQNENKRVDITLNNVMIKDSYINNSDSVINTLIFGNIDFTNVTIMNTKIYSSSFLNLTLGDFIGQIIIDTMTFSDSIILDSQLFKFSKNQFTILIKNIHIENCDFINSRFFYFTTNNVNDTDFIFQNIIIKSSRFINSLFLDCSSRMNLKINNFSLINNNLTQSIIIGFSYNLQLFQISVIQNIFVDSQFLSTMQMLYQVQKYCKVNYFKGKHNQFQNSNLILIFSTYQMSSLILEMTDIILEENSNYLNNNSNQSIHLFNINCYQIFIQNVQITNSNNIHVFYLFENHQIIIQNVIYQQLEMQMKVQISQNCTKQNNPINQLIQILGFTEIVIQDVQILNLISLDESIIQITSSKQYSNKINRKILIKNLQFQGNLLLQQFQIIRLSLITINSDLNAIIQLENIKFFRNFMHVYQEGSLLYSAGLIYITSTSSQVKIKRLFCKENAFTNSSNSFIIITSDSVELDNVEVYYQNNLPLNLWKEYYNISADFGQNQEQINQLMSQIFQIKTIGGAFQISASNIICVNSKFDSIYAQKVQVFDIITFGQGIISFMNISINNTSSDLISKSNTQGCINIDAQTSFLNLSMVDVAFLQVQNRMASSILSISPSSFQNQVLLKNILIENCISLINQVINVQFNQQIAESNVISFQNIKIIQNLDSIIRFFQQVKTLNQNDILEITGTNNAVIFLENSITTINGLIFEGIFIGPLLKFINNPKLNVHNCLIFNIQTIYTFNLIYLSQNIQQESFTQFHQLRILKVTLFEREFNLIYSGINQNYSIQGCILSKQQQIVDEFHDYLYENVIALRQSQEIQINSILYLQSSFNLNVINFNLIQFQSNNCSTCSKGIAYFDVQNFSRFTIGQINCNFNTFKNYGCLNFQSKILNESQIVIQNSNFIYNIGGEGTAIRVSNLKIIIKQCKFIYNIANESGGGLYLNSNSFVIKNSIITNNKAKTGGGIYISGGVNLNQDNLIQSILIYNYAEVYGNNMVEQPTHLALQINNIEQPSLQYLQNDTKIDALNIYPYKTLQQSVLLVSSNLMIPSNQQIYNYTLFYLEGKEYITYVKQIGLYFKNNYNEELLGLKNTFCYLYEDEILNVSKKQIISRRNQTLQFNTEKNCFDIGHIIFSLDPYNQSSSYLQILISCNLVQSNKTLKYLINANSFKCQLGEFYVDNGCQICKSNQGFYSVTYDAIKCSIFDKAKFLNITANMIQLQQGYWRPHYLSDYSQVCFKNLDFCKGGWSVGDELCKIGHLGGLCEECDFDNILGNGQYFKNQWNLSCFKCFEIDNGALPLFLALIQALISIFLTLRSIHKSNRLFASLKIGQRFSNIIFRLNQDHESILIKMWLNYLWIFSVIFTFNINFSFQFTIIDSTSNSFYFMAYNLDCYLSNYGIPLIYLRIFLILFLMLIQFWIIFLALFIYSKIKKQQIDYSILSTTLLYLFVFNYGGLIKMLSSIVSIRKISNINYVQGDVSLKYGTPNHLLWIIYLILPGLLLFGCLIPFILFLLMYTKRHQFETIKLRKHICYLMNEYSYKNYFWEFIKISNKAVIILITTYFETDTLIKASLLGLCLLVYQILSGFSKPYYLSKFNSLDIHTGQICSIAIFLATIKFVSEDISNESLSIVLSIVLILLCVKLCFPFIIDILKVYYKKFKSPFITFLLQIVEKIKQNSMFSTYLARLLQQWKLREERLKINYTKLRTNLFSKQKMQIGSKKLSQSLFNSTQIKTFQQSSFRCFIGLDQD